MENPSIYDVFERMWQHILTKLNSYATNETFNYHVEDKNNPHGVTAEQVGLGDVDNTADMDKPISNLMQVALDDKADRNHEHSAYSITTGVLSVENGGTGYGSIVDNSYSTPRYRASALVSYESYPYYNGVSKWVYE